MIDSVRALLAWRMDLSCAYYTFGELVVWWLGMKIIKEATSY